MSRLRPNPADHEAERAVLGAILLDSEALAKIADSLAPEAFDLPRHRLVYRTLLELSGEQRPTDLITLRAYLEERGQLEEIGGLPVLTALLDSVATSVYVEHHAELVQQRARAREAIRVAQSIERRTFDGEPLADVLADAEREVQRLVGGAQTKGARRPVLVRMSDVEPEEVGWMWEPYIPLGKLTLLEGDPGLGKTWLALSLAAAVTRGFPLPGADGRPGTSLSPGNVLYLTAEDGLGDTLRPRLDRAQADVSRVTVLDGLEIDGRRGVVTLRDTDEIESALRSVAPSLVVVDPVQGFLGAGVDMHRANEVRPVLSALGRLADEYAAAVLAIRHLRKSASDRAVHRGLGSIDFAAGARSILLVAEDPEQHGRRIMAHAKSNLAPMGPSVAFEIRDGAFCWAGGSDLCADDLLAPREAHAPRDEAKELLREVLGGGRVPAKEVKRIARDSGVSESTLDRAQKDLGVRHPREGFGKGSRVFWELPSAHTSSHRQVEGNGDVWGEDGGERARADVPEGGDEVWSEPADSGEDGLERLPW